MLPILLLALADVASAACPEPVSADTLGARLDDATGRYRDLDLEGFRTAMDRTALAVPCLDAPIAPPLAARYHRMQGLRSFVLGDEEHAQQAFLAARRIDPDYRFPDDLVPSSHPVREHYGALPLDGRGGPVIPRPTTGQILLDGVPAELRPERAAAVFQHVDGDTVLGNEYLWPADALPAYAAKASGARRWLTGAGIGLMVAGAASYGAGFAVRQRYDAPETPVGELDGLRTTMHALGGVGIGLGVVGGGLLVGGWAGAR